MNTTIPTRTRTKLKLAAVTGLSVLTVGGTGFAMSGHGDHSHFRQDGHTVKSDHKTTSTTKKPSSSKQPSYWQGIHDGDQNALIVSSVDFYIYKTSGVSSDTYQVTDVQTWGNKVARGKIYNGTDPDKIFYAVNKDGRWQVIYLAEASASANQAKNLKLPTPWANDKNW